MIRVDAFHGFPCSPPTRRRHWIIDAVLVAIIYVVAAWLGQSVAIPPGNVTAVWPSSGLALAALLKYGWCVVPGIWLGGLVATIRPFFDVAHAPSRLWLIVGVVTATGIVLQSIAGAALTRRLLTTFDLLHSVRNVLLFLTAVGCGACLISATVGTLSLYATGLIPWARFAGTWSTWYLGDTAGVILFTPFLLVWTTPSARALSWRTLAEGSLYFLVLLGVLSLVFHARFWFADDLRLTFVLLPCLMWAGFRFGQRGATAAVLVVSSLALWTTARGEGPFIQSTVNSSLLVQQSFLAVISGSVLVMVAALAERKRADNVVHELRTELAHASRVTSLSEMASGLAHELSQPLGSIANNAQAGLRGLHAGRFSQAEIEELLAAIAEEAQRTHEVIRSLRALVARSAPRQVRANLNTSLQIIVRLFERGIASAATVTLRLDPAVPEFEFDPVQVQQAVLNLMHNAWDAVQHLPPQARQIQVGTARLDSSVEITVMDNGTGILSGQLPRVFEAYYTTKESGLGLGLNIARQIAEVHGGKLSIICNEICGVTARLTLPVRGKATEKYRGMFENSSGT